MLFVQAEEQKDEAANEHEHDTAKVRVKDNSPSRVLTSEVRSHLVMRRDENGTITKSRVVVMLNCFISFDDVSPEYIEYFIIHFKKHLSIAISWILKFLGDLAHLHSSRWIQIICCLEANVERLLCSCSQLFLLFGLLFFGSYPFLFRQPRFIG